MLFQLVIFENRNVALLRDALSKWLLETSRIGNDHLLNPSEHTHLHDDISMSSLAQNPYNGAYNGYMMRVAHDLHASVLPYMNESRDTHMWTQDQRSSARITWSSTRIFS